MLTFPSYPVFLVQGDIGDPESTRVGSQAEVGIWYWFGPTRLGAGINDGSESVPSQSCGNTTAHCWRQCQESIGYGWIMSLKYTYIYNKMLLIPINQENITSSF